MQILGVCACVCLRRWVGCAHTSAYITSPRRKGRERERENGREKKPTRLQARRGVGTSPQESFLRSRLPSLFYIYVLLRRPPLFVVFSGMLVLLIRCRPSRQYVLFSPFFSSFCSLFTFDAGRSLLGRLSAPPRVHARTLAWGEGVTEGTHDTARNLQVLCSFSEITVVLVCLFLY